MYLFICVALVIHAEYCVAVITTTLECNNNTGTIVTLLSYLAIVHFGHLRESRSAPGGRQLVGQV